MSDPFRAAVTMESMSISLEGNGGKGREERQSTCISISRVYDGYWRRKGGDGMGKEWKCRVRDK